MKFENRLLAFFDILGFKEHLRNKELDTLYEEYSSFVDEANKKIFGDIQTVYGEKTVSNFEKSLIFSDSILLISYDVNDIKSINKFLLGCITLMQESIKYGFVLRGAIGYGKAIYDEEKNIFLSKEFAELYLKEGKQNWAGCGIFVNDEIKEKITYAVFGTKKENGYMVCDGSTEEVLYQKLFESNIRASSPILEYKIPNTDMNSLSLNYLFTMDKESLDKVYELLKDEPKGKLETTKEYYNYIFSLDDTGNEFENLGSIHKIKIMLTQTSAKVKFEDINGNGTDYIGQNITVGFI